MAEWQQSRLTCASTHSTNQGNSEKDDTTARHNSTSNNRRSMSPKSPGEEVRKEGRNKRKIGEELEFCLWEGSERNISCVEEKHIILDKSHWWLGMVVGALF